MVDGACSMNVLSSARKNRAFRPDNRGMLPKCRVDGAEGTETSVFELMEWPSRDGWLHDESSCPCRVELKAPYERVLALRTVRCRGRDALPWRKDMTSNESLRRCVRYDVSYDGAREKD